MNIQKLLKEAQKAQQKLAKIQEESAKITAEAQAGGGMVKATANGEGKILSIIIDPEIVKEGDIEMLQDLIIAAVNASITKAKESVEQKLKGEMQKLTGGLGLNIPGLGL